MNTPNASSTPGNDAEGAPVADVTVVMPSHNTGPYVAEALDSIAAQTLRPARVVVIDDGSTDGGAAIAEQHALRPTVLRGRFGNAARTRNHAALDAETRWLAFLDSDDRWLPHHLETAVRSAEQHDAQACVCARIDLDDATGETNTPAPMALEDGAALGDDDFYRVITRPPCEFQTPGLLLETARFREVGGFDGTQASKHDLELCMRFFKGVRWVYRREPTWEYRLMRQGSLTNRRVRGFRYMLEAYLKNESRWPGPEMRARIGFHAKRSLGAAVRYGTPDEVEKVWAPAMERLGLAHRLYYWAGRRLPGLMRPVSRPPRMSPG
ncbi:MAG: glycosyltransferase family 2 protein [Planctomycetota bacterium]